MLFDDRSRPAILRGEITMTVRRWSRPQARTGGRYRFDASHVLVPDQVEVVPARAISDADARLSGYAGRSELLGALARRSPLADDETLYRITFHIEREADRRDVLAHNAALSADESAAIIARLERMDASGGNGPWTRATLMLIGEQPRVAASRLAQQLKRERLAFKADVRKLKALGLTISHETGYELSPRGRALLARLR